MKEKSSWDRNKYVRAQGWATMPFEGDPDMASAYGIVNNRGGRITVDSQLDKETIVRVWLPALFEIEEMIMGKYRFGS